MLVFAYLKDNKNKIHISDYNDDMKNDIFCPIGHSLIAKKGKIKIHHFAHKKGFECVCSRDMSEWHSNWQKYINIDNVEVIIKKKIDNKTKKHIADCVNQDGIVIEFQKSIINENIIKEREEFYDNMIWIFDVSFIEFEISQEKQSNKVILHILSGSKFFTKTTKKSYLDTGKRGIIEVEGIKNNKIVGYIIEYKKFIDIYFKNIHNIKYFREDAPLI